MNTYRLEIEFVFVIEYHSFQNTVRFQTNSSFIKIYCNPPLHPGGKLDLRGMSDHDMEKTIWYFKENTGLLIVICLRIVAYETTNGCMEYFES